MCKISCLIKGEDLADPVHLKHLSVGDTVCYKCAGLVSCNVECIFSQYRSLFCDKQQICNIWFKDDFCGSLQECFTFCLT
jgi:hypothetical protein